MTRARTRFDIVLTATLGTSLFACSGPGAAEGDASVGHETSAAEESTGAPPDADESTGGGDSGIVPGTSTSTGTSTTGETTSTGGEEGGSSSTGTFGTSTTQDGGEESGASDEGSDTTVEEGPPAAPEGVVPNEEYPADMVDLPPDRWRDGLVSPTLEFEHHNQPSIINGYLQITGNSRFSIYDISNPREPVQLSHQLSPNDCTACGEAEGHQVSFAKYGDRFYTVTIQGRGVDLWDITDVRAPEHLKSVDIEGVNFGDFTEAVWGVAWQGHHIFVGGTNTGLHVIDASDPADAQIVARVANLGGVSAGPVFPVGNVLVVTTPKNSSGVATLDISNPRSPVLLASIRSSEESYIGAVYGHHAYLLNPLRVYDVLSNPVTIQSVNGNRPGGYFEYLSFQDGFMFAGRIRPEPGAAKFDVRDPSNFTWVRDIHGRRDLQENDDQFTIAVGNLLIMSDDQLSPATNRYAGTVIAVHDTAPDTTPPRVDWIIPNDGAVGQATTSRIGISFTDNVELATVDTRSFIVRPVGGSPLRGTWGVNMSILHFDPDGELEAGTTYEVVLPAGGIKDYVGNALAEEFRSTFTTR